MSCLSPCPVCAKEHYCFYCIPKVVQKFTLQCSALNEFVHQGKPFNKVSLALLLLDLKKEEFLSCIYLPVIIFY